MKSIVYAGLDRKTPQLGDCGDAKRLQSRGMAPKAIIGASMRRLVHLIYGIVNSGKSFDMDIPMRNLAFQDGI